MIYQLVHKAYLAGCLLIFSFYAVGVTGQNNQAGQLPCPDYFGHAYVAAFAQAPFCWQKHDLATTVQKQQLLDSLVKAGQPINQYIASTAEDEYGGEHHYLAPQPATPGNIKVLDFNGDGLPDIVNHYMPSMTEQTYHEFYINTGARYQLALKVNGTVAQLQRGSNGVVNELLVYRPACCGDHNVYFRQYNSVGGGANYKLRLTAKYAIVDYALASITKPASAQAATLQPNTVLYFKARHPAANIRPHSSTARQAAKNLSPYQATQSMYKPVGQTNQATPATLLASHTDANGQLWHYLKVKPTVPIANSLYHRDRAAESIAAAKAEEALTYYLVWVKGNRVSLD